jgi:conjugative transfer signal peptidase TraF
MSGRRNQPDDAPLLAWGEALRAAKAHHARMRRRMLVGGLSCGIVLGSALQPPSLRLVWNASASAPIGLYLVSPGAAIAPGDMVIARVPEGYRALAASRRYLPTNVPLVKRVAAQAGNEICALGAWIFIDGRPLAKRLAADAAGRKMPAWTGCQVLQGRQVLLLMDDPSSFDGRYFGPSEGGDIVGKARLLWRR